MPPNVLIVLGIAAIFALFLSDNKTESEVKKEDDTRVVPHGGNRTSRGSGSRLGKRGTKRDRASLKVSHFIEDDEDGPIESRLDDENETLKEDKKENHENA